MEHGIDATSFWSGKRKGLVNVGLARGMIGRPKTGLVPIRGHSGVQGAAEVGSVPTDYLSGFPVNESSARKMEELWGVPQVPSWKGLSAAEMIEAAHEDRLDAFYIIGGDFLDTMPEPVYAREALERVPLRIHQDIVLNSSMWIDPKEVVLLLPAQTRYERFCAATSEGRLYSKRSVSQAFFAHKDSCIFQNFSARLADCKKECFSQKSQCFA